MNDFTAEIKDDKVGGEWILCIKQDGILVDEIPCSNGNYPPSSHDIAMFLKMYRNGFSRGCGWTMLVVGKDFFD